MLLSHTVLSLAICCSPLGQPCAHACKFMIIEASETTLVRVDAAYLMRKIKNFDHCARKKIPKNSERGELDLRNCPHDQGVNSGTLKLFKCWP